jgi:hypothetical protein
MWCACERVWSCFLLILLWSWRRRRWKASDFKEELKNEMVAFILQSAEVSIEIGGCAYRNASTTIVRTCEVPFLALLAKLCFCRDWNIHI